MLIIVDIDGTLACLKERYKAYPKPNHDDKAAFQQWVDKVQDGVAMLNDKPIGGMLLLVKALKQQGHSIFYLTGRSEKYRKITRCWLKEEGFPEQELIMRADNDWSKPFKYKEVHVKRLVLQYADKGEGWLAIDDDFDGCCSEMYRKLGGTHLKVMGDSL